MNGKIAQRFFGEEKGQAMVLIALLTTVLLGITALTVDMGYLQWQKRQIQNTADASALAGAQDLQNAEDAAQRYAELNGVPDTDISVNPTNIDPTKCEVVCTKNVQYTFARVLGFNDATLEARAVAAVRPVKSYSGAVPLGVEKQTFEYGKTYVLKKNAGAGQYHGNFGCLALGDKRGANVYGDYLKYGYNGWLEIGDKVDTEPGNMAGDTSAGLNYRINQDPTATFDTVEKGSARIVVVPVVNTMDVNGRKEVTVVGFAVFFLESSGTTGKGNNAEAYINGKFMEMALGNSVGGGDTSYGAYKVQLTE